MSASRELGFSFRNVVIVADLSDGGAIAGEPVSMRRDLEKTEDATLAALIAAIDELGLESYHYRTPRELARNAGRHREDIVWSIYGGENSRNRMALVPAICESHDLSYIGPDVYGRIICQDKEISKRIAVDCGLRTPNFRVIREMKDVEVLNEFPLPFVVKPLLEGSSIGIGPDSLVRDVSAGRNLARDLLLSLKQPLIIEQFAAGREVSYCAIQSKPVDWSFGEIAVEGIEDYFDNHLFDANEKKHRLLPRDVHTIDSELDSKERLNLDKLLSILGKYNYCRIDGKFDNGTFVFLEITPDAWIAPTGAFAKSFVNKGWAYSDVIRAVLYSATADPQDRPANG